MERPGKQKKTVEINGKTYRVLTPIDSYWLAIGAIFVLFLACSVVLAFFVVVKIAITNPGIFITIYKTLFP